MTEKTVDVQIVIDGKEIVCRAGETVIQAADRAGIYIPRFCYHDRLSVVANCRMCLVDVHKAPKALPACATPVSDGMEVSTRSKRALSAQRAVMEFLLINHPLDCPICDQGGECELQDAAMGFGRGVSRYDDNKRAVADEDLGPLIDTHMTRCIHCTRCVRFGDEIAGMPEMGALGRGENTQIGTYLKSGVHSELSGNMIDVCPVGALTAKPSAFKGRSWSFQQHALIAQHDGVGSHIYMHTLVANTHETPTVMRVVPKACEAINEVWLSNVDRFSYLGLMHKERLTTPWVKRDGEWQAVDWVEALDEAMLRWRSVLSHHGQDAVCGLISPNATCETLYLFQKWLRSMGITHIDHRLKSANLGYKPSFSAGPILGLPLEGIVTQDLILLVGDDVRRTQPMLNHRIRQAQLRGAQVFVMAAFDPNYNYSVEGLWVGPDRWSLVLQSLATKTLLADLTEKEQAFINAIQAIESKASWCLLGQDVMHHPHVDRLHYYAQKWQDADATRVVGHLTAGPNSVGAWLMGALPHQGPFATPVATEGLSAMQCAQTNKRGYWLHQVEPDVDTSFTEALIGGLKTADCVVACSAYDSPTLRECADVLLPIAPFSEEAGTVVNMEGRWQHSAAAMAPMGEARPAWKVYRVLGNLAQSEGFDYQDLDAVRSEINHQREHIQQKEASLPTPCDVVASKDALMLLCHWPLERSDAVLRRSEPLQKALDEKPVLRVNQQTLAAQGLSEGKLYRIASSSGQPLPLCIDEHVADGVVYYCAGLENAPVFSAPIMAIALEECQ